ncbi:MAG: Biotin/lipoate A/B protein ligase [Thelocarpon superellum]|nr:MAG: Biotin/lipoate A/B protein ligase [Thelocarpon superellum]
MLARVSLGGPCRRRGSVRSRTAIGQVGRCGFRRPSARWASQPSIAERCARPASQWQVYISRSTDPYLNLSIEHYLLQKTPPASTVLFLYTNRPCVVIGRNQNPWVEVNLPLLNAGSARAVDTEPGGIGKVLLVRRRSGGGTVFHDEGNLNYSVICPPSTFTRDKHAAMVVRALRRQGVHETRVNERHDIVMDPPPGSSSGPVKVSGSAYKLTRQRALHHGTCLLSSPHLHAISSYLRSPAKPYIKARGVESVSSPIGNVGVAKELVEQAVLCEFGQMYGLGVDLPGLFGQREQLPIRDHVVGGLVGDAERGVPEIQQGMEELQSDAWTFLQTPQFTFSSCATDDDGRPRPAWPEHLPSSSRVSLDVRSGVITAAHISLSDAADVAVAEAAQVDRMLKGRKLHDIDDWLTVVKGLRGHLHTRSSYALAQWLNDLLRR